MLVNPREKVSEGVREGNSKALRFVDNLLIVHLSQKLQRLGKLIRFLMDSFTYPVPVRAKLLLEPSCSYFSMTWCVMTTCCLTFACERD